MLITFSGLDGSGKTTIIAAARTLLERRNQAVTVLTMYDDITLYAFVRRCRDGLRKALGRDAPPAGTVQGDERPGRGVLGLIVYGIARHPAARACVLPLDVVLFVCRSLYERRVRRRVLIMDRYFYDSLADVATGGQLAWLYIAVVLRLLPRPRAPIFVEVSAETAYARKPEYPLDDMRRRRAVYQRIFAAVPRSVVIENYDRAAALRTLEDTLRARLDRPGALGRDGDAERLGNRALGLLLGVSGSGWLSSRLTDDEWRALLPLAEQNLIAIRLDRRLRELGVPVPHPWATRLDSERERIRTTVELIGRLTEICEAAALDFVFTKSFQHFPDMGHDVDLLVLDRSRRVDGLLKQQLHAAPEAGSVAHRMAGKRGYAVPGYRSPVEIHHGRLGLLGEHAAYPALLVRRRRRLEVDGIVTWVPSCEDQLIVQALQRIYAHLSLRLSDVLHTVELIRLPGFDWDYVVGTARRMGLLDGLACYLRFVEEVYRRSTDAPLESPAVRRLAAASWAGHPQFRGAHYRFPRGRVLARVYGAKLLADAKSLDWRGVGTLLLLVPVALIVGLRTLWHRLARLGPRGRIVARVEGGA